MLLAKCMRLHGPHRIGDAESIQKDASNPLPYSERMTKTGPEKVFLITDVYVKQMVAAIVRDNDLSRYIL